MVRVLGVHMGHDASVTLLQDGEIAFAMTEERLVREKLYFGFPRLALQACLDHAGISAREIDVVALDTEELASILGPIEIRRRFATNGLWKLLLKNLNRVDRVRRYLFGSAAGLERGSRHAREVLLAKLARLGFAPGTVQVFDHHRCHAASACFCSPFDAGLFVTSDGRGDGLSAILGDFAGADLEVRKELPDSDSLGQLYAAVTMLLGFRPNRHEGKITGLAAMGDPQVLGPTFLERISWRDDGTFSFTLPERYRPDGWADQKAFLKAMPIDLKSKIAIESSRTPAVLMYNSKWVGMMAYLQELTRGTSREDVAASVQYLLEQVICELVRRSLGATQRPVVLAGGVFANVKVNQRIRELEGVENIFVQPAMGDDGLSLGAALLGLQCLPAGREQLGRSPRPCRMQHAFLGPEYPEQAITGAAARLGFRLQQVSNPAARIAKLIHQGQVVGVYRGRLEFGPRALGHRSILVRPTDRSINQELNRRLDRTEFMPFAPSMLAEHAASYLIGWREDHVASRYMTVTYDIPPERQREIEAVVHVDGTARPQVVHRQQDPEYWSIIEEYRKLSGIPVVVNTSFNVHEEPIVCTPEDALRSFQRGCVDALFLEGRQVLPE